MTRRERAVVVCPGRGTYNQTEWGYLGRHHADKRELLAAFDDYRTRRGQPTLSALDRELAFQMKLHTRGEHASALIYACACCDARDIDTQRYEIVAVTGNSMGWYIALVVAGALSTTAGFHLVNTMGRLMQETLIGGQLVYPWVDDDWKPQPDQRERLLGLLAEPGEGRSYLSIDLGGMLVFGGDEAGLKRLERALPRKDRFPLRLYHHAAFHTPLQAPVREIARRELADLPLAAPRLPLIDGRGQIWTPYSTDPQALWDYTLGSQLVEPYDFTAALAASVKEFAPDRLIVLGPGNTLTGAVAQALIGLGWYGWKDKRDFQVSQGNDPRVLALGWPAQRALATGKPQRGF
jgi:[acyl-carrier-protein] S-malonyltransferase